MLKKEWKPILLLFILISLICGFYFGPNIVNDLPLLYGTDIRPQWFPFYEEFTNLLDNFFKNGSLPFYSWSSFLGTNFFASKSYYLMGDIFSYIGYLTRLNFFNMALFTEILKYYVAGFSMYFLLSQFKFKPLVKVIGAICYTFSGWAIFYSGQLVFLSFYALVPLYFSGIEHYLKNKKSVLFIIMTALCLFTNFYFFFTLSCFTIVYYIFRYYNLKDDFRHFFKDTLVLIGYYVIGVCITMILTLPTIYYILGNDRLGNFKEGLFFNQIQVYLHNLVSIFIPNYLYIYGDNAFETLNHYTREICMFGGVINAILLPQIFISKNKKLKISTIMVFILFIVIMLFPRFGSIVHGFGDPSFRWIFFLILFNIIISSFILNDIDTINKKVLKITGIITIIILISIVPITTALTSANPLFFHLNQIKLFAAFALLSALYILIIISKNKYALILILSLTTLELLGSGFKLYNDKLAISKIQDNQFTNSVTHVLQDYDNQLNEVLDNIEPINQSQYYRVYIPHDSLYWEYSHNMAIFYQLNGTMTYDSAYSPSINKLKQIEPSIKDYESEWIFNIKDSALLDFLNVKYAIVTKKDELPLNGNWRLLSIDFRSGFQIYRNDNYRDLGTTYHKINLYDNYTNAHSLLDTVYCDSHDYNEIKNYLRSQKTSTLENISYYGNQLTGYVYSDEESFMVITLPYDAGWNIKVNGQDVNTYDVNGGFIGIPIQKGDNNIEMYFTPQGFKTGAILTGVGCISLITVTIYQNIRRKNNALR